LPIYRTLEILEIKDNDNIQRREISQIDLEIKELDTSDFTR